MTRQSFNQLLRANGAGEPYGFNRPDPLHIGVCGTNGAIHDAVLTMMQR